GHAEGCLDRRGACEGADVPWVVDALELGERREGRGDDGLAADQAFADEGGQDSLAAAAVDGDAGELVLVGLAVDDDGWFTADSRFEAAKALAEREGEPVSRCDGLRTKR